MRKLLVLKLLGFYWAFCLMAEGDATGGGDQGGSSGEPGGDGGEGDKGGKKPDDKPPPAGDKKDDGSSSGDDKVSHKSYLKVLGEKKKMQEQLGSITKELEDIRETQRKTEEGKLKENKEWQKLAEQRGEDLETLKAKISQNEVQTQEARKLESFLEALPAPLDRRYWGLIDLDKIAVNPDSKEVDEMSVTKAVENFQTQYPEVIINPNGPKITTKNPRPSPGALTVEEWKKLPPKERKAKMHLVAEAMAKSATG